MTTGFISDDFLLQNETARLLYHDFAEQMPIYDYHCHLAADALADDLKFKNLTQAWLSGDHYKWRALRANAVPEEYITGRASDDDKFLHWAGTVPYTIRNPLYHWTHLELKRYFGVDDLLTPQSAPRIYQHCNQMLADSRFSVRSLLRKMNVAVVCTTDDPTDRLDHHQKISDNGFETKVYPTWRPDRAMALDDLDTLNQWIDSLAAVCDMQISDYASFLAALHNRHDYFHNAGCRASDHGLERVLAEDYTALQIERIFDKLRRRRPLELAEKLKFKSALMVEFAVMDHESDWAMQLHIGPLRNTNSRMFKLIGPDTGFDCIGESENASALARFLDRLSAQDKLPRTILYNLNPRDNEMFAAIIGCFQDSSIPGKIQYGPAWWFLDQKDGIERHLSALSNMGLLRRFVGMVTDSRSFLSFPRHEYFRRILCNLLGSEVEMGLLPRDMSFLGEMVREICFTNARNYFSLNLD